MIENLTCPTCDGPMTSRKNNTTGQRFWGCNSYPKCKGTRNTDGEAPRERPTSEREDRAPTSEREDRAPSERLRDNDRQRWRHS